MYAPFSTGNVTWTPNPSAPGWFLCDQHDNLELTGHPGSGWTLYWGRVTVGTGGRLSKRKVAEYAASIINGNGHTVPTYTL